MCISLVLTHNMDESQKHCPVWEKPDTKKYMPYDWFLLNEILEQAQLICSDGKQMSSCLGSSGEEWGMTAKGYIGILGGKGKVFYLGCDNGCTGRSTTYTFFKTHSGLYFLSGCI